MRHSLGWLGGWLLVGCGLLMTLGAAPASARVGFGEQFGENAVGANTHVPNPRTLDLAFDLRLQWVRMDNHWFHQGVPCSTRIEFLKALDLAVTYAVEDGLNVYMTLSYTADCGSTGGRDDRGWNDVPDARLFANFVRQAVAHYRALGVRHFGIWNEPNSKGFFEGSPDQYVDHVLIPGFSAVAQGCRDAGRSDCSVLGPDLAHSGDYHTFLEHILNRMKAASLMFDVFTHHIYQAVATPLYERDSFVNALDDRRFSFTRPSFIDVLNKVGFAPDGFPIRPVWITETGYRAKSPIDPGEMAIQSDRLQEILNVQLARPWYTNTIFYDLTEPQAAASGYGITQSSGDGTYFFKTAYLTLRERLLEDPRFSPGPLPRGFAPNVTSVCTGLGRRGFFSSLPDKDDFSFNGSAGELVSLRLDRDPQGPNEGKHATLIVEGKGVFFFSRGALLNDITLTLPESGRYTVSVTEQTNADDGPRFKGDYCLSLESSGAAFVSFD